jgi:gamma-glutamyltranspeptidase/glutathione hydrolase
MDSVTPNGRFLTDDPTWAMDFAPHEYRVKLGETMTRKRYADTLEVIASEGADAFYTGAIANATITALRKANGTMTLDDLKNYTVAIRKPAQITYRGYKLTSCSAPASGVVTLSALKIVEGYEGFGDPGMINLTTHRLDEAIRFAYGERGNLGDPSFFTNLTAYQDDMLSEKTAAEIRSKISDATSQNVSWYDPGGIESLETPGTSHVVTADASGMAVSLTTTINLLFGSQLMVPETGVILNNEQNDFSVPGANNGERGTQCMCCDASTNLWQPSDTSPARPTTSDPESGHCLRYRRPSSRAATASCISSSEPRVAAALLLRRFRTSTTSSTRT